MRLCRHAVFIMLAVAQSAPASAADCAMAQLQINAGSVVEPCSARLATPGLTDAERAQALFVRARAYHRTRRLDQAADDYRAAFALDPKNEEILVSWSNIDLRQRRMRDYRQRVEQAYKLNPDNPHVLRTIGAMHGNFGDADRAVALYTRALAIDPAEPFALLFRAQVYRVQRKLAEAIADLNALVAIPRATLDQYGFLDSDGTVRDFQTEALIKRAYVFAEAGQLDAAEKDHDAAVSQGRSAKALMARGWFLRGIRGRAEDSLRDLKEAVQKEPTNADVLYALGITLVKLERFADAFSVFDTAVTAHPHNGTALRMRARLHRQFGRTDAAVSDYEDAILNDPEEFERAMSAMRHSGYWTSPRTPDMLTPDLRDAIRACMIDVKCN